MESYFGHIFFFRAFLMGSKIGSFLAVHFWSFIFDQTKNFFSFKLLVFKKNPHFKFIFGGLKVDFQRYFWFIFVLANFKPFSYPKYRCFYIYFWRFIFDQTKKYPKKCLKIHFLPNKKSRYWVFKKKQSRFENTPYLG